ncbi:MAG: hypothetical protein N3A66_03755, partial [Planctomycetota bacterium]|nr:hypothetical protein [Planctomycetota bacterium]
VDFYQRPGKAIWSHPEMTQEDGSGSMFGSIIWQQVMRGIDGVGWSGRLGRPGRVEMGVGHGYGDSRSGGLGMGAVCRATSEVLKVYGPWLRRMEKQDPIAIAVSTRMLRLDDWGDGLAGAGVNFGRLYEAYNACLYAHRPASFVFTEDVKPDSFQKFKAVLIVNQTVELDPPLATALAAAQAAGIPVYYDDTCRKEIMATFKPLGFAFDGTTKEYFGWNDDTLPYRAQRLFASQADKLAAALGPVVPAVAEVANPALLLSVCRNGEGRFLWVVNNDVLDWEPAFMWRVSMFMANRRPQIAEVEVKNNGGVVYDVFAMREVKGKIAADLRYLPARLFAILPQAIASLSLAVPANAKAGEIVPWEVAVKGPKMAYPLRLRLLESSGAVLADFAPAQNKGTVTIPLNAGPTLILEAREMISGKRDEKKIQVSSALAHKEDPAWSLSRAPVRSAEELFGPHLRDLAVTADGATAMVAAMNWDDNIYLLDTATGKVRERIGIGNYTAHAPLPAKDGFYVQGFDVTTAEVHHLYKISAEGRVERRFANYGVANRGTHWAGAVAGGYSVRINKLCRRAAPGWPMPAISA